MMLRPKTEQEFVPSAQRFGYDIPYWAATYGLEMSISHSGVSSKSKQRASRRINRLMSTRTGMLNLITMNDVS